MTTAYERPTANSPAPNHTREVTIEPYGLKGVLSLPEEPKGLVVFVHGSGSSRLSPRNTYVAERFQSKDFATFLFDLLTEHEELNRENVFDVDLLAGRLSTVLSWLSRQADTQTLPIGLFGASTGAAAALTAAADNPATVHAVVSRGGRPDLAIQALPQVRAPTLLIVGDRDHQVLALNKHALDRLETEKELATVHGATHLFEEPGCLDQVVNLAATWFEHHLHRNDIAATRPLPDVFRDRVEAGQYLAQALSRFAKDTPVVVGLPRGGVPVAFEVARALDAPLDVILVRKIGAPFQPELAIGAVVDGDIPEVVLNAQIVRRAQISDAYIQEEERKKLDEIEQRRALYRRTHPQVPLKGRTVILVDDGIATGATALAAIHAAKRRGAERVILAVPVGAQDSLDELKAEVDDLVCLHTRRDFRAVGFYYHHFDQVTDAEVGDLLDRAYASPFYGGN